MPATVIQKETTETREHRTLKVLLQDTEVAENSVSMIYHFHRSSAEEMKKFLEFTQHFVADGTLYKFSVTKVTENGA